MGKRVAKGTRMDHGLKGRAARDAYRKARGTTSTRRQAAQNDPEELARFNREIDLPPLAAHFGYLYNKHDSTRTEHHFSKPVPGERLTARHARPIMQLREYSDGTRRWRWFDPLQELRTKPSGADGSTQVYSYSGDVVDFVRANLGFEDCEPATIGRARKFLRNWVGSDAEKAVRDDWAERVKAARSTPPKERKSPDQVEQLLDAGYKTVIETGWTVRRGVTGISEARFTGTIFRPIYPVQDYVTTVFPQWLSGRITSYEVRAFDTPPTSLRGGTKGLWYSRALDGDERVVAVESPLDALSFDVLHGDGKTRYVATFGTMSESAKEDLARKLEDWWLPVYSAFDNDSPGDKAAATLRDEIMFDRRMTARLRPATLDWNDDLRLKLGRLRDEAIAKVREKAAVDLTDPEVLRSKLEELGLDSSEIEERMADARALEAS